MLLLTALIGTACGNGTEDERETEGPGVAEEDATVPPSEARPTEPVDVIDLATTAADQIVFGADRGDLLADRFSLAVGDFNSDGIDDILVGAPLADGPTGSRTDAGEAYVIFGTSEPEQAVDLAEQAADLAVYGTDAGDNLGFTVASGDVNGDGVDDVLVGARFASGPGVGRAAVGGAYVIFGSPSLGGSVDIRREQQDLTIFGADSGDFLSFALASGDFDGDGVADIFLGAPGADGPANSRENSGEAYVILGREEFPDTIDLLEVTPHFVIYGPDPEDALPNFVTSGDIDGDGKADVILGVPGGDGLLNAVEDAGEVYAVCGSDSGRGSIDLNQDAPCLKVTGADRFSDLGKVVAAGDLDGDGRDDVLVGVRHASGPAGDRAGAGELLVVMGSEGAAREVAPGEQDLTIFGPSVGASFGHIVTAADLNGDTLTDILASASTAGGPSSGRPNAGEVYAFLSTTPLPEAVDTADGRYDLLIRGAEPDDLAGFSLATGDIDGDGKLDVLLGALQADGPDNTRESAGELYVILGKTLAVR